MPGQQQQKRQAPNEEQPTSTYVSPVKRVKQAVRTADKRTIKTVDDELISDLPHAWNLKAFIRNDLSADGSAVANVVIQAKVAWTSFEVCQTGPVARMHLVDKHADETVEEMHKVLRGHYAENKRVIDSELITASVYGVDAKTKSIPADGAIITIRSIWAVKLFLDRACQLTTSLDSVTVEATP